MKCIQSGKAETDKLKCLGYHGILILTSRGAWYLSQVQPGSSSINVQQNVIKS